MTLQQVYFIEINFKPSLRSLFFYWFLFVNVALVYSLGDIDLASKMKTRFPL